MEDATLQRGLWLVSVQSQHPIFDYASFVLNTDLLIVLQHKFEREHLRRQYHCLKNNGLGYNVAIRS